MASPKHPRLQSGYKAIGFQARRSVMRFQIDSLVDHLLWSQPPAAEGFRRQGISKTAAGRPKGLAQRSNLVCGPLRSSVDSGTRSPFAPSSGTVQENVRGTSLVELRGFVCRLGGTGKSQWQPKFSLKWLASNGDWDHRQFIGGLPTATPPNRLRSGEKKTVPPPS